MKVFGSNLLHQIKEEFHLKPITKMHYTEKVLPYLVTTPHSHLAYPTIIYAATSNSLTQMKVEPTAFLEVTPAP